MPTAQPSLASGPRPDSDASSAKIKGAAFLEILRWYAGAHGPERLFLAASKLPYDLKRYVTNPTQSTLGLLPGSWYPAELIAIVFREMVAGLPPNEMKQLAADAVKASVGNTLKGIYAPFIRLLVSPKMLAEHYQKIWRLYHNSGQFDVIVHGPTHQEFRLSGWPAHDPFLCLMNLHATRLILEMTGQKDVRGELSACVNRGDAYCAYSQRWKA